MLTKKILFAVFCVTTSFFISLSFCHPILPSDDGYTTQQSKDKSQNANKKNNIKQKRKSLGHMDFDNLYEAIKNKKS